METKQTEIIDINYDDEYNNYDDYDDYDFSIKTFTSKSNNNHRNQKRESKKKSKDKSIYNSKHVRIQSSKKKF